MIFILLGYKTKGKQKTMNHSWEYETGEMLKKINEETKKLLNANLPDEEFHKKHQELMDYWSETSKIIQQNHPFKNKPKARPKHGHQTHHMTDKYLIHKLLRKF